MGKWNVTKEDVAKGALLKPGWYEVEIAKYEEKPSKSKDSMNANITYKVLSGDNAGANLFSVFNEKAPGFMVPFLEALGVPKNAEGGYSIDLSESTLKGRKLKVNVVRGEYNGKPNNQVSDYTTL